MHPKRTREKLSGSKPSSSARENTTCFRTSCLHTSTTVFRRRPTASSKLFPLLFPPPPYEYSCRRHYDSTFVREPGMQKGIHRDPAGSDLLRAEETPTAGSLSRMPPSAAHGAAERTPALQAHVRQVQKGHGLRVPPRSAVPRLLH